MLKLGGWQPWEAVPSDHIATTIDLEAAQLVQNDLASLLQFGARKQSFEICSPVLDEAVDSWGNNAMARVGTKKKKSTPGPFFHIPVPKGAQILKKGHRGRFFFKFERTN